MRPPPGHQKRTIFCHFLAIDGLPTHGAILVSIECMEMSKLGYFHVREPLYKNALSIWFLGASLTLAISVKVAI